LKVEPWEVGGEGNGLKAGELLKKNIEYDEEEGRKRYSIPLP
jgi:hypothetical protein